MDTSTSSVNMAGGFQKPVQSLKSDQNTEKSIKSSPYKKDEVKISGVVKEFKATYGNAKMAQASQIINASSGAASKSNSSLFGNVMDADLMKSQGDAVDKDWGPSQNVASMVEEAANSELADAFKGEFKNPMAVGDGQVLEMLANSNKTESMDSVNSNVAGENNVVKGPRGWASENNSVNVTGNDNTIDISSKVPEKVKAVTYEAVGGADVDRNSVAVTGDQNAVKFEGGRQNDNNIVINGTGNDITVGKNVDALSLNIAGDNVTVKMNDEAFIGKTQDSWNINVNTDNVQIEIKDGNATVSGTNGNENYIVEIDEATKTVSVFESPSEDSLV